MLYPSHNHLVHIKQGFLLRGYLTKLNEMVYMAKQLCLKCNNYVLTEKIR